VAVAVSVAVTTLVSVAVDGGAGWDDGREVVSGAVVEALLPRQMDEFEL